MTLVLALLYAALLLGTTSPIDALGVGVGVFLLPALLAGASTGPVAGALGGRIVPPRSFLLAFLGLLLASPFLVGWRVLVAIVPSGELPPLLWIVLLSLGPALWFRHLTLFGVSNPDHLRTLPASLLQPVFALVASAVLISAPTPATLAGAFAFLLLGFLTSVLLLRAADRPLRREFDTSGVGLIRPLLEHVASRDPQATRRLEEFFGRHAIEADLRVTLIEFRSGTGTHATVALPTVHPGPFAAVGASDLPRKIDEAMGPRAGLVFVPHTPCNHDLDLPSEAEVDRVRAALRTLSGALAPAARERSSPLVAPRPGTLARAQVLGDAVLVLISQAPAPSDDIDYAVVDPLYDRSYAGEHPVLAFIDAHNCYLNDLGDLTYGSPTHKQLVRDIDAAVAGALAAAVTGPVRIGVGHRGGYSVAEHGIGPEGIRALVVDGAGGRTAYVLIDGNNLASGMREPVLAALAGLVDASEVMTTDNHVVHEVDGGINTVGERYPAEALARDVRGVVEAAVADLGEVTVRAGRADVPGVRVLGPGWTARLLTSLGDTLSVFGNAAVTTFLLLVTSSVIVLALLA